MNKKTFDIAIIGGGFSGLNLALKLSRDLNKKIILIEKDPNLGGLASTFTFKSFRLEKYYHHWFTGDVEILNLIKELGLEKYLIQKPSNTGVFYANSTYRLSSPLDLLRFKPLSFFGRIRLGIGFIYTSFLRKTDDIENQTAEKWLIKIFGNEVFSKVWLPLLKGKFGDDYKNLSAIWMWKKLGLRGSSRSKDGRENLIYFNGSFEILTKKLQEQIEINNGTILQNSQVSYIEKTNYGFKITADQYESIDAKEIIFTTAPAITAQLAKNLIKGDIYDQLNRVKYLGNVCIILFLEKSLSEYYWLNVNDPNFPFVGVIEHTNFDKTLKNHFGNIVYLSRYCSKDDIYFNMNDEELISVCKESLSKMFSDFDSNKIKDHFVWKSDYSQPFMEVGYKHIIPPNVLSSDGVFQTSMANIYPEDRGTNYAVKYTNEFLKKYYDKKD